MRPAPPAPARTRLLALCLALSACTTFPEVAAMEGPAGPAPPLLPLDGLLPADPPDEETAPDLGPRAQALRARAAAIGAP